MTIYQELQLTAIANLAINMSKVDGSFDRSEFNVIASGFHVFGVTTEKAAILLEAAMLVAEFDAISIIKMMSMEDKRLVSAWLLSVMAADGRIDPRETSLYRKYQQECGLLPLSSAEAQYVLSRARSEISSTTSTSSVQNTGSGCMVPIVLLISALALGSVLGCGPSEPTESEIANGMRRQFIMNTGAYPSSVRAKKIGSGRWAVRMTAERYGERRSLDATAIMDKNGDIHYYTN